MKLSLQAIVKTGVLAALAIALQMMNLPQPVTGPGINAILFVAACYVGPLSGALIGILTPWLALVTGVMALAPAVPVIMAGNVTLALVAGYVGRINRYAGLGLASVLKFGVMTAGVRYIVSTGTKVPPVAYTTLTITQLFTALGGAVVAAIILEVTGRMERKSSSTAS